MWHVLIDRNIDKKCFLVISAPLPELYSSSAHHVNEKPQISTLCTEDFPVTENLGRTVREAALSPETSAEYTSAQHSNSLCGA